MYSRLTFVLLPLLFLSACVEPESTTVKLSFYALEDGGVITVYVDGDFIGEVDEYSTDGFSVDCEAPAWPKAYLTEGTYFIEYYRGNARYASQDYTVSSGQLGGCIPLVAYP